MSDQTISPTESLASDCPVIQTGRLTEKCSPYPKGQTVTTDPEAPLLAAATAGGKRLKKSDPVRVDAQRFGRWAFLMMLELIPDEAEVSDGAGADAGADAGDSGRSAT